MNRKATIVLGTLWTAMLIWHMAGRLTSIVHRLPSIMMSSEDRAAFETGDLELHRTIRAGRPLPADASEFDRFRTLFERYPVQASERIETLGTLAHLLILPTAIIAAFLLSGKLSRATPIIRIDRLSVLDSVGVVLLTVALLIAGLEALMPHSAWSNWDAWAVWIFKTKAVLHEGWIPRAFLADPAYQFTHPEYPLLWPWIQAGLSWANGGLDNQLLGLLSLSAAMISVFAIAALLSEIGVPSGRWLIAGMIGTMPLVLNHSSNGYVDWPLAAVESCALLLAMRWRRGAAPVWAVGLAAGLAANLKMEGLIFGIGLLGAMFASGPGSAVRLRSVVMAFGLFLLLALPWQIFRISLGITPADFGLPIGRAITELPTRITLFIGAVLLEAFAAGPNGRTLADWWTHLSSSWLVFWFAAGYAVISGWRMLGEASLRIPLVVVSVQVLGALGAYLLTVRDVQWLLTTSLDRLMLQWVPAVTVISCALLMQKRRVGFSGSRV